MAGYQKFFFIFRKIDYPDKMRVILVLIGLAGVLIFGSRISTPVFSSALTGNEGECYTFCSTGQPLAAIENSVNYMSGLNSDKQNNSQKRTSLSSSGKHSFDLLSIRFVINYSYLFLGKSISLFLLFHSSQSLWMVYSC